MSISVPLIEDFRRTIGRLDEVLKLPKNDIVRDSAIKRFELCFDLSWNCIQALSRREGLDCQSPRSCLKTAVQLGLIAHNDTWLKMLEDRNLAVHTYKEKYADEIYIRLPNYRALLADLVNKLSV